MLRGLGFCMPIAFLTLAVRVSAGVNIHIVIINNFSADCYTAAFFRRFSVNGNFLFGKDYFNSVFVGIFGLFFVFFNFRKLRVFSFCRFVNAAGSKREHEHQSHEHG